MTNLEYSIKNVKEAQKEIRLAREKKKKVPNFFKVNVDAAKAFDSLLRHKIIDILKEKGVNIPLVNAI